MRYLSKFSVCAAVAVCVAGFGSLARADVMQDFNSGPQNFQAWTVNNGGGQSMVSPMWNAAGGNSGGYISANIGSGDNRLFDFQPATAGAYGNLTGMTLTADTKLVGGVTGPDSPTVRFYIGSWTNGSNYFVSADSFSWNPNMDQNWVIHQIQLVAADFIRWPNCDADSMSFDQVVANVQDIGLVFTGGAGQMSNNSALGFSSQIGATFCVDNFGAVSSFSVAEPATMSLLGLGGALMVMRGRRK